MFVEPIIDRRAVSHRDESDDWALTEIIRKQLKPIVRKVDEEAYYPAAFFRSIGEAGLLDRQGALEADVLQSGLRLVEETSQTCMTTGFALWCHLAAMIYIRSSDNVFLRQDVLPRLESGALRGGTGLSNPLKSQDGLEKLCLKAKRVSGGYIVSGQLPFVSNVGRDAWFGIIATTEEGEKIMALVDGGAERLTLKERRDFLGLNGCATCTCTFRDVFVPDAWLISEQADEFVEQVRALFLLYQIPLGFGVTAAAIHQIERSRHKQSECNQYLPVQAEDLEQRLQSLRAQAYQMAEEDNLPARWMELLQTRRDTTLLTSEAVHTAMVHHGGSGYLRSSDSARRLRESYFLVNLTPTVKHLEKALSGSLLAA
jgi:alkylation response protein AidB-like acyl-CoA dehydrogenase